MSGCASRSDCTKDASSYGYFCHKNHNYGKNRNAMYRSGVIAGCRTAEGYYSKDYSKSSWSNDYNMGWADGRATCRHTVPKDAEVYGMRTEYQQSIDQKRYRAKYKYKNQNANKIYEDTI